MELLDWNIREHADINCILHVNATSDSSGHIHIVNHIYRKIKRIQHHTDCRENCALGTDEIININLIDFNILHRCRILLKYNNIAAHSIFIKADTFSLPDKFALWIDNPAAEQLTDQINDTGTADTDGLLPRISDDG